MDLAILTMDDFDAASKIIHDHVEADANVLVGLFSSRTAGKRQVTILAIHQYKRQTAGRFGRNVRHRPYLEAMGSACQSSSMVNAPMV